MPLCGSIAAPAGASAESEKVRLCPALGSVAEAWKVSRLPSGPDLLPITARTGGWFAPLTKFAAPGVGVVHVTKGGSAPSLARPSLTSSVCAPQVKLADPGP